MQILHRFSGSIQQYVEEVSDPDRYRPGICPRCRSSCPLTAHGFYRRAVEDEAALAKRVLPPGR